MRARGTAIILATLSVAAKPTLAHAHHALGGRIAETFLEGFFSGCAHPVLGADHLIFLLAAGLTVGALRLPSISLAAFVAATAVGLAVHVARIDIPAAEAAVAISLLALGAMAVALRSRAAKTWWLAALAAAGLIHGYAYGESIVGATASPLAGYVAGLWLMQAALVAGTFVAGRALATRQPASLRAVYACAAAVAGTGLIYLIAGLASGA